MIVRRYKGKSLEALRKTVVKEMGEHAVIIHTWKVPGTGILGSLKGHQYELVAAVEDATAGNGSTPDNAFLTELMDEQKNHYVGLRRSLINIDEKINELEERFHKASYRTSPDNSPELQNVHGDWHKEVIDKVNELEGGAEDQANWYEALASKIPTAGGILFRKTPDSKPDIYALTGPTGVGKTTTLAKMAAVAVLKENLNVGIITIDTFRVGAVDQIREYSSLLGVELAVVFSENEMVRQLEKFQYKDVVFIDTQGRGPYDSEGIEEIKRILNTIKGCTTVLTVPAAIREEDAIQVFDAFGELKPSCIVLTKTDEASRCDGLTRMFDISKLPVVYLTDGQKVPEDIHPASPGTIASMIIPAEEKVGEVTNGA